MNPKTNSAIGAAKVDNGPPASEVVSHPIADNSVSLHN